MMKKMVRIFFCIAFIVLGDYSLWGQDKCCRLRLNVDTDLQFSRGEVLIDTISLLLKNGKGDVNVNLITPCYYQLVLPNGEERTIYLEPGKDLEINVSDKGFFFNGILAPENRVISSSFECPTSIYSEPDLNVSLEGINKERVKCLKKLIDLDNKIFKRLETLRISYGYYSLLPRLIAGDAVFSGKDKNPSFLSFFQKILRGNDSLVCDKTYLTAMRRLVTYYTSWIYKKPAVTIQERNNILMSDVIISSLNTINDFVFPYSPLTAEKLTHEIVVNYINNFEPAWGIDYYYSKFVKDENLKKEYAKARSIWDKALPGEEFPDLIVEDLSGKRIHFSTLFGKVLFIDFWASWCGPCRGEMRNGAPKLHAAFPDGNVEFVYLSIDKNKEDWKKAVEEDKAEGLHLWIPDAATNTHLKDLVVKSYPRYILVGKDGKIIDPNAPRPSSYRSRDLVRRAVEGILDKEEIQSERLKNIISTLADPSFQGREPGTLGDTLAMEYIRKELFQYPNIKPLGTNGLQSFTVYERQAMEVLCTYGERDTCRMMFPLSNSKPGKEYDIEGKMVFLGYGEKEDMDKGKLSGRWALLVDREAEAGDDFPSYAEKALYAVKKGAVGVVVIPGPGMKTNELSDKYSLVRNVFNFPIFIGNIGLAKSWGVDVNAFVRGDYEKPYVLKDKFRARVSTKHRDRPTFNIVGILEGNDPVLKNEVIVVGAHYDHLGMTPAGCCCGADDNASGVAGVLEIARILSENHNLLKRSVVFAFFGGEEKGLLGSQYFNAYPLYQDKNNVLMLNLDMIGRLGARATLYGLRSLKERADLIQDLSIDGVQLLSSDMIKGDTDHSSFIRERVPAIGIITEKHKDYHSPGDTFDKVDIDGVREIVRYWLTVLDRVAVNAEPVSFFDKDFSAFNESQKKNWFFRTPIADSVAGIDVPQAIEFVQGKKSAEVTVAVIDSGLDVDHREFKNSLWKNREEIPGDGLDNDKNGYADDVYGWNFLGEKNGKMIVKASFEADREFVRLCDKYLENEKSGGKKEKKEEHYFKNRVRPYSMLAKLYDRWSYCKKCDKVFEEIDRALREKYPQGDVALKNVEPFAPKKESKSDYMCYKWGVAQANVAKKDSWEYVMDLSKSELRKSEQAYRDSLTMVRNMAEEHMGTTGNHDLKAPNMDHGTHVAGIISQIATQFPDLHVKIMGIRVVPDGDEYDRDVARAIRYAVDNGAKIINLSLGKIQSPEAARVEKALQYAEEMGVLIVHAAGNDAQIMDSIKYYPNPVYNSGKRSSLFIQVGSIDSCANPAYSTNYGNMEVDLMSPGVHIYSSVSGDKYEFMNGTSMAAPVVSGVAAVLMAYYPNLSAIQIKDALLKSVYPYEKKVKRPCKYYGFSNPDYRYMKFGDLCKTSGVVNLYRALIECNKY